MVTDAREWITEGMMGSGLAEPFAYWSGGTGTLYMGLIARGPRIVDDSAGVNRVTRTATITLSARPSDGLQNVNVGQMVTIWDSSYATGDDSLLTGATRPAGATDYRVDQVDYVNGMIRAAVTAIPTRDLAAFHRGR